MQLRVRSAQGAVTMTKPPPVAAPETHHHVEFGEAARPGHGRAPATRVYQGDAGRPYDTINAEVVGVFRDLAEPPATGERLVAGRVLGHIEALRLRNEVRCPSDCTLIAQVVVDGQPVDFGEPLFVVDSATAAPLPASEAASADGAVETVEPPRM
jgi:acetyl-CoA carboxylase biotin carboxyl carrier protein